ncbi:MAG: LysM peptidoglycan-binding domain-containing protein [Janthinobacterium lividum]
MPAYRSLFLGFSFLGAGWLAQHAAAYPSAPTPLPAPITTPQLISQLTTAIQNLKTLRCQADARERIGSKYVQDHSQMKIAFSPLRVYIKNGKGVEVLYVAGQNGGDAWVNPNAFPYVTLSLDPNGSLMRKGQHHTALQAGFGTIADLLEGSAGRADKSFNRSFRYAGDTTVQGHASYVLRSDYPQFRYVAYKAGQNETPATVATRFGCGEYRILERNKLAIDEKLDEGQVLQVPNAYARRTIVLIDPKTFLPNSVTVYDDRGLFEKYDFSDLVVNQPIPPTEFAKDYKGYKF